MIGTKEIPCIKCKTPRKVRLGEEKDDTTGMISHGIAHLIDTANELLPRLSRQQGSEEVAGPLAGALLGGRVVHIITFLSMIDGILAVLTELPFLPL